MIHLINCEHDDEGGFILLAGLTDAQRAWLMQVAERIKAIAGQLTEIGAGRPLGWVCYHVDLKGRYIYSDAPEALATTLPGLDADDLAQRLDDEDILVLDARQVCQPQHASGDALMRSLRVFPDGQLQLVGTIDDEYIAGVGWVSGPSICTVCFDLAATTQQEE